MPPDSELVSLTALAEGPFTTASGTTEPADALLTRLRVPIERVIVGAADGITPSGAPLLLSARFAITAQHPQQSAKDRSVFWDLADREPPWAFRDRAPSPSRAALLADRRFLVQHVYAVAASTLFIFESTLGRRMSWAGGKRLAISAFDPVSANDSGYDREERRIRLGHRPDTRGAGEVPLALFRDIVAHEVTHAVLDGYRPRWADAHAGLDTLALHEAVADLVAILSVFSADERVEQLLGGAQPTATSAAHLAGMSATDLRSHLCGFGDGLVTHAAVRNSLTDPVPANWRILPSAHARSQAIVHAMLAVLVRLWLERLDRPGGRASLTHVAAAGAVIGRRVLSMLVRGLGYLPPVDATWEDLLHGVLAADEQLVPGDDGHYRDAVIEAFATIGVKRAATVDVPALAKHLRYPVRLSALGSDPEEVVRLIWENPALIDAAGIDPSRSITVDRVRPSVRVSPDGFVVSEIGASFTQEFLLDRAEARRFGLPAVGPVLIRGGGLLRFDEGGRLSFAAFAPAVSLDHQRAKMEAADASGVRPHSTGTTFHPPLTAAEWRA